MMKHRLWMALLAACAVAPAAAQAPASFADGGSAAGFAGYIASLRSRAIAAGVRAATFDAQVPSVVFDPSVIASDRAQPGGSVTATGSGGPIEPFAPYRIRHVDADRIGRGRPRYQALRPLFVGIEARTGVPEAITMAIWGHETDYGASSGHHDLLSALGTLAYEGRRRTLFEGEFIAALELIDRGTPREELKGSWAGATGYPQSLPSQVLRLGRDGDGDGRVDIWHDQADALASIGAYLLDAGWKPGVPWGIAVSVPDTLDRASLASHLVSPRCPRVFARHSRWLTVAEWRKLGLVAEGAWPAPDEMASLLEPDGPGRTAYLLTGNYRAILDYNCSNFYALSVGLLADAIAQ